MKISPVAGTPTIPQPQSTGLSAEKLQRIKSMAMGAMKEEESKEETVVAEKKDPAIKMQTNKTPEQALSAPQEEVKAVQAEIVSTQENAVSDADVQTNPSPEATQQVSPQVAALAKQKRALQVKEAELAKREEALKTQGTGRAELEQRVKSGNALSVLQDLGITYDQLTNELLGKQATPDFTNLTDEILKKVDEKLAGNNTAQEEAVFEHIKRNVDKLTYSSDNYPFVKAEKAQEKVVEFIKRAWNEDGEVLDEEDALSAIEAELKEKAKTYAKLLGIPEQTTPEAVETSPKAQQLPTGIKTLTNRDSARPQSNRRQRALAAFLGQKQG